MQQAAWRFNASACEELLMMWHELLSQWIRNVDYRLRVAHVCIAGYRKYRTMGTLVFCVLRPALSSPAHASLSLDMPHLRIEVVWIL
jgi:hypothetical protein